MKLIFLIGLILLGFGYVVGIGYWLYLWGAIGMLLGLAMWTAFKVWAKLGAGTILTVVGAFSNFKVYRRNQKHL